MAEYKHTISLQTKRVIRWFRDANDNHEIRVTIAGRDTIFYIKGIGDANRQYERLAAI